MSSLKRPPDESSNSPYNGSGNEAPSTPNPKRLKVPSCYYPMDTPLARNTNSHTTCSINSSTITADTREKIARKQSELKNEMKYELGEVIYEGDWVRKTYCFAPDDRVKNVTAKLCEDKRVTVRGDQVEIAGWPEKANEALYYEPLADLLNSITDIVDTLGGATSPSRYKGVKFRKHDKEMRETVLGEDPINPDIIAYKVKDAAKCASWYRTYFVCEVKRNWSDLVYQAATYARCMFAANEHRFFVPILLFNHITSEFRLGFFHRSGLLATTAMDISTTQGFHDFVYTIVGIWGWKTRRAAGFDMSQSHSHIVLNRRAYRITRVLCRRQQLHGRGTNASAAEQDNSVSLPDSSASDASAENEDDLIEEEDTPSDPQPAVYLPSSPEIYKNHPTWARLNPFDHWKTSIIPKSSHTISLSQPLPDKFVIKCSFVPHDRIDEKTVFKDVQQYIGIPKIIGSYEADCLTIPTGFLVRSWLVDGKTCGRPYLPRYHQHLLIGTIGRHLESAKSPRELGEGLLHAMIGHCVLFTVGKYLHRDVSNGNIILLDETERREIPPFLQGFVKDQSCRGVLIDGDVAKKWESESQSQHRSGTKPFISKRVTETWAEGKPYIHTPIDDLESFVWVLIYTLLAISPIKSTKEAAWWNAFNSDDLSNLVLLKDGLAQGLARVRAGPLFTFKPLLQAWTATALQYETDLVDLLEMADPNSETLLQKITILSLKAYLAYIEVALKHVPLLETEWPPAPVQ